MQGVRVYCFDTRKVPPDTGSVAVQATACVAGSATVVVGSATGESVVGSATARCVVESATCSQIDYTLCNDGDMSPKASEVMDTTAEVMGNITCDSIDVVLPLGDVLVRDCPTVAGFMTTPVVEAATCSRIDYNMVLGDIRLPKTPVSMTTAEQVMQNITLYVEENRLTPQVTDLGVGECKSSPVVGSATVVVGSATVSGVVGSATEILVAGSATDCVAGSASYSDTSAMEASNKYNHVTTMAVVLQDSTSFSPDVMSLKCMHTLGPGGGAMQSVAGSATDSVADEATTGVFAVKDQPSIIGIKANMFPMTDNNVPRVPDKTPSGGVVPPIDCAHFLASVADQATEIVVGSAIATDNTVNITKMAFSMMAMTWYKLMGIISAGLEDEFVQRSIWDPGGASGILPLLVN